MATITPDEGLEFTSDRLLGQSNYEGWQIHQVAAGTGSANLDQSDTQLDQEVYRANKEYSNLSVTDSSIDGRIVIRITLSGGTEVPADTTITEFGVFAADPNDLPTDDTEDSKDALLHRELRSGVTLESGDRKTFEIPYTVETQ